MKVIGLTGGIASGKSTASNILKQLDIPVIDADIIARQIVDVGQPALYEIKEVFGSKVIHKDGSLNRKKLGDIVFSNKEKLKKLNEITHKRIIYQIVNAIEYYRRQMKYSILVIDAALLIEMNMKHLVDEIWLIVVSEGIQLNRLMNRDYISLKDAQNRIKSQMPIEEKKKYADVIIDNSKDFNYLRNQIIKEVKRIYDQISEGSN